MKKFRRWNDIQSFHEVVKNLNYPRIHAALSTVNHKLKYGLKVKLHGTNACVRIESDGKVVAQKRSSDIVAPADNSGFRAWVESEERYFGNLANCAFDTYIYGEWCGSGIQNNVACSETKLKHFYVFAIDFCQDGNLALRIYCPDLIENLLTTKMPDQIVVIPWHSNVEIDFLEKAKTETTLNALNSTVEAIGERCPLIYDLFEIEGSGEGVVAYPLMGKESGQYQADEDYFSWFNFKAKSEAHRVNKTPKAANFDPEKYASIQLFADAYCTEQRFEQGFKEAVNEEKDMKRTPDFIKWVVTDIHKESETEREASEIDWKAASKACSTRAVLWYKNKVQEL